MNLTQDDIDFCRNLCNETFKWNNDEVENNVKKLFLEYIHHFDESKLSDRNRIFKIIEHLSTLYLNLNLNSDSYLLNSKDIEKVKTASKSINKTFNELKENGFKNQKLTNQ